jgi:hypothetical protein
MSLDSYEQQASVSNTKTDEKEKSYMTSEEIKAGSRLIMTHAQRQAFLKTSALGQLFGIAHLLSNSTQDENYSDNSPNRSR